MNYIVGRDNSSETIYEFELIIAVKKIGGVLHDNTQEFTGGARGVLIPVQKLW